GQGASRARGRLEAARRPRRDRLANTRRGSTIAMSRATKRLAKKALARAPATSARAGARRRQRDGPSFQIEAAHDASAAMATTNTVGIVWTSAENNARRARQGSA